MTSTKNQTEATVKTQKSHIHMKNQNRTRVPVLAPVLIRTLTLIQILTPSLMTANPLEPPSIASSSPLSQLLVDLTPPTTEMRSKRKRVKWTTFWVRTLFVQNIFTHLFVQISVWNPVKEMQLHKGMA